MIKLDYLQIKKPRSSAFIRLVLQSNGFTVFKVNALSGYVIVDSNRTVLHFATPKAALSMNGSYAILIDPGAVVGQGCSNDGPPTPGITSPIDWAFPVDGVCPLGYALVSPSFQKCEGTSAVVVFSEKVLGIFSLHWSGMDYEGASSLLQSQPMQ